MTALKGKTIAITGASRGIGLAIAERFAQAGANIVVLTKDLDTQIMDATSQIKAAGGEVLTLNVDVSDMHAIQQAVIQAVNRFGGIDALINNTSATSFNDAEHTTPQQFDLVMSTSARAAFFISQACLPYLKKAQNPHIINISPPINLDQNWFKDHLAFTIGKYAMSMCTLGIAVQFQNYGIAVNSLWPRSTIATQTIIDHFSPKVYAGSRWPSIMGDAAYELILKSAKECTGQFFTDEALLRESGIDDFSQYAVELNLPLMQALFISREEGMLPVSQDLFL